MVQFRILLGFSGTLPAAAWILALGNACAASRAGIASQGMAFKINGRNGGSGWTRTNDQGIMSLSAKPQRFDSLAKGSEIERNNDQLTRENS
jgi:hypothetical protein